ncbi:uncharacterized protein LOC142225522 [Haematobia irritans]|uniref:uncharacterized protein LOC142225522 n=1 Tax=Haematobia irritans TaxID=7368 RepID=UPI003F504F90
MQIVNFLPQPCHAFERNVATAEIKLVIRMIMKNQSFNSMDKLSKFHCSIYLDSAIAKSVTCGRTKSKEVAQFLGKQGFLLMVNKMKRVHFSLIIDETTDISTEKCLVIVVRQFDEVEGVTKDSFFNLMQPTNASGEGICSAVLTTMAQNEIPLANFIGFSSYNASTMVGKKVVSQHY